MLRGRMSAQVRQGTAVGVGRRAGGLTRGAGEGVQQAGRAGGQQEAGVLGEVVDHAAGRSMGCQVGAGVGVGGRPVGTAVGAPGHLAG